MWTRTPVIGLACDDRVVVDLDVRSAREEPCGSFGLLDGGDAGNTKLGEVLVEVGRDGELERAQPEVGVLQVRNISIVNLDTVMVD